MIFMNKKANVWVLAVVGVVALFALGVLFKGSNTATGYVSLPDFSKYKIQEPKNIQLPPTVRCDMFTTGRDFGAHLGEKDGHQYCKSKRYDSCAGVFNMILNSNDTSSSLLPGSCFDQLSPHTIRGISCCVLLYAN